MRVDKRLHLVVPIYEDEEGGRIVAQVHSTPIAEEIVDRYFMVLGQTYSAIFSQGLGLASGPSHAMRVLRHIATERGVWNDDPKSGMVGVEKGLVEEMRRLTMVAVSVRDGDQPCGCQEADRASCKRCGGSGRVPRFRWDQVPLQVAVDQGVLSRDDLTEVENAIAFFIVASATLPRAQRPAMLKAASDLWGAQVSSSSFTEWFSSLRTSTATASSGAKSPAPASGAPANANATVDGKPASVPV